MGQSVSPAETDVFIALNQARGFELELPCDDWEAVREDVVRSARETGKKMAAHLDQEMSKWFMTATGEPETGEKGGAENRFWFRRK